jgi:hypothetical protein
MQQYTPQMRSQMVGQTDIPPDVYNSLTDKQFAATFDRNYQQANPYSAARDSYDRFDANKNSWGTKIGDMVRPQFGNMLRGFDTTMDSGYAKPIALGAGVGLIGGALLNQYLKSKQYSNNSLAAYAGNKAEEGGNWKAGLLGALVGGGALAYNHYQRNQMTKSGSAYDLIRDIERNGSLSITEKQALIAGVRRLSNSEANSLSRGVSGLIGAALGAAVGRFLSAKGLLMPLAGAIIGGVVGYNSNQSKVNAFGQYVRPY